MSKDSPETLLSGLYEQRRKVREILSNYTIAYEQLIDKFKRVEETEEIKELKREALENLIAIEDEYDKLKELISKIKEYK